MSSIGASFGASYTNPACLQACTPLCWIAILVLNTGCGMQGAWTIDHAGRGHRTHILQLNLFCGEG